MCFLKTNVSHCAAVLAALRSYHDRHGLAYAKTEPCLPEHWPARVTQFHQPGYNSVAAESHVDVNFCASCLDTPEGCCSDGKTHNTCAPMAATENAKCSNGDANSCAPGYVGGNSATYDLAGSQTDEVGTSGGAVNSSQHLERHQQSWSKVMLSCEMQKGQKSTHMFPWFGGTDGLCRKFGPDWQIEDLSPYPAPNSPTFLWFPQLRGGFANWTRSVKGLNRAAGCAMLIDRHIWFPWTHTDWLLFWILLSALWLPQSMVTFVTCRGSCEHTSRVNPDPMLHNCK